MPHGGARKGSGRKSAAIEDDVKGAIKAALARNPGALEKIWDNVIKMAEQGSDKHANIFLNYYFGKPKENEGQPGELIVTVVRK